VSSTLFSEKTSPQIAEKFRTQNLLNTAGIPFAGSSVICGFTSITASSASVNW